MILAIKFSFNILCYSCKSSFLLSVDFLGATNNFREITVEDNNFYSVQNITSVSNVPSVSKITKLSQDFLFQYIILFFYFLLFNLISQIQIFWSLKFIIYSMCFDKTQNKAFDTNLKYCQKMNFSL